jgi:hypothetical protein
MYTARTASARALLALLAGALVVGCADPAAPGRAPVGEATLEIDGRRIDLDVVTCGLIDGRFPETLPPTGSERTLTAAGETEADGPIRVSVRRTRDDVAPQQVQTVEISLGDPEVAVQALVLYRGLDEATGRWSELDPDAPDPRVEVPGPLLEVTDAALRAEGSVSLPDGERVMVRLDARCPVVSDGTPGVA